MPSNYLYAEFLSNIRQVTLYASLVSSKNNETKIQLLSDKQSISLSHDGETATILLPTKIAGSAQLTIPTYCAKELSFRLQVAEAIWPLQSSTTSDNNEAPWSARTLDPRVQISCRACKNLVIESSTINTWKDLPSEYWAEMMEFWHCHKPHDDHGSHKREDNASKGYGASTHIVAEPGIGLVDASSFLFAEEDCRGVQISSPNQFNGNPLLECQSCHLMLGVADTQKHGWKVQKWNLAVTRPALSSWETISPTSIISVQLLSLMDARAVRKFVVHQGKESGDESAFILWVFNPDLRYSTSSRSDTIARAMKIFYRPTADPEALLKQSSLEYEELCLPSHILAQLHDALRRSSDLLPASARKFKEWDVGLLDRSNGA